MASRSESVTNSRQALVGPTSLDVLRLNTTGKERGDRFENMRERERERGVTVLRLGL